MLTSPQSFINCSFQMCQRGKGLLGRLEIREKERRGDKLLSGRGSLSSMVPQGQLGGAMCSMGVSRDKREVLLRDGVWNPAEGSPMNKPSRRLTI